MKRFFLPLAACALTLSACAGDAEVDPVTTVEEPVVTDVEPVAPAPPSVDVQGTISALEGGITNLAPAAALDNINGWIAQLDGMDGADGIVDNLEELRDALGANPLDGEYIGELLSELGAETTEVAGTVTGTQQDGLMRLGELLSTAGSSLNS
jgi:hypothetical protein